MLYTKHLAALFLLSSLTACFPNTSDTKDKELDKPGEGDVTQRHDLAITWEPVSHNINDDTITNVAAYKVEWQKQGDADVFSKLVEGQMSSSTQIFDLEQGNYTVSIKTVLTSGLESDASQVWEVLVGQNE